MEQILCLVARRVETGSRPVEGSCFSSVHAVENGAEAAKNISSEFEKRHKDARGVGGNVGLERSRRLGSGIGTPGMIADTVRL